jgi:hypothetical protein
MKLLFLFIMTSIQCMAITFPIVAYSKTTGTMLGIFWQTEGAKNKTIQFFGLTQKNGVSAFMNATNYPLGEHRFDIQLLGSTTGKNYNGISTRGQSTTPQQLYFNELSITLTHKAILTPKWTRLIGINIMNYKENTVKNKNITYFKNISKPGLILGLELDQRNKQINTTTGRYSSGSVTFYESQTLISTDHRNFIPLTHGVLAAKFYSSQTLTKNDHIQFLSGVGNYTYLRGYKSNHIIDRHLSYFQLEWRQPLTSWLTLVPFIEVGVIGRHPGRILQSLLSSGIGTYLPIGAGALRIEIAMAESNREFYFGFNHVF